MASIADDSGLVVEALDGEPGVYSSRYSGENASDKQNINKLLSKIADKENRRAFFATIIIFVTNDGQELVAEGKVSGHIIDDQKGGGGFGYDPIFVPEKHNQTFAQMSSEEKNKLSHRGKALLQLREMLLESGYLK